MLLGGSLHPDHEDGTDSEDGETTWRPHSG